MRRRIGPRRWREYTFGRWRFSGGAKRSEGTPTAKDPEKTNREAELPKTDGDPLTEQAEPAEQKPVSPEGTPPAQGSSGMSPEKS